MTAERMAELRADIMSIVDSPIPLRWPGWRKPDVADRLVDGGGWRWRELWEGAVPFDAETPFGRVFASLLAEGLIVESGYDLWPTRSVAPTDRQ